jgi:phosphoglucosamine mutase
MTIEVCQKLAEAIVVKFCPPREKKHAVIIAHDNRQSADMFECAMAATFYSLGVDVMTGIMTTPKLSISVEKSVASAGVMITASHNPFYDNGFKVFNEFGLKLTNEEEAEIENLMNKAPFLPRATGADIGRHDWDRFAGSLRVYKDKIRDSINIDRDAAEKIKVVLDCANSMVHDARPLEKFGFKVIYTNVSYDGTNINENCGVTHPNVISEAVLQHKADIGIAFDGDGDRVLISDENGRILDGDHILAAFATMEKCDEVVSTILSNFALEKYLSAIGVKLTKTQVGDRYISEYTRKNDSVEFGAEPSGHVIIKSHCLTGDGLFAGLKVLEYMLKTGKKCSELRLFEPCPTVSKNLRVEDKDVVYVKSVQLAIQKFEKQLEGRGKLVVRPSGTEPVIRIHVEGEDPAELQSIADELSRILGNL